MSFASLGLSVESLRALERVGFSAPTPLQEQVLSAALSGHDVVCTAATALERTIAFALPLLERHQNGLSLILSPTRERAAQVQEQLQRLSAHARLPTALLVQGTSMALQTQALRVGAQIIVATVDRLVDHLDQGTVRLGGVSAWVLDEADQILAPERRPQLDRILSNLPSTRQTLLFAATVDHEVAAFVRTSLREPVQLGGHNSGNTVPRARQEVYDVAQTEKSALLLALLQGSDERTLIFTRTKHRASRVTQALERAGKSVSLLHADRDAPERSQALAGFESGKYRILVATEIAARGVDVAAISHVVSYDLPHVAAEYAQRMVRNADAADAGRASSFSSPDEASFMRQIERLARAPIARTNLPRGSRVFQDELARADDAGPGRRSGTAPSL